MITQVTHTQFHLALQAAQDDNAKIAQYVYLYNVLEYKDMDCYLNDTHTAGYAIKADGDIVSVFNNSYIRGVGKVLMVYALATGGIKLDCFDGFLPGYYSQFGFSTYKQEENWDGAEFPDVVYMSITGKEV